MTKDLFRSADLAVRARLEAGEGPCVVTFDSYTDVRTLDRNGFGEEFFDGLGIDAIHVLSRQNDWYQYPELLDAAAAARELLAGRDCVVAYGSSMGGYAAIRFGALFGAQLAAAFSPQFSIDPAVAPFEKRWIGDAERIDFLLERASIAFTPKSLVFYDPHDTDKRHVDLFRPHTEVVDMPVPMGGHPCTTILGETKLLRPLILQILQTGRVDDFQERYRSARRGVSQLFFNLSLRARRPRAKALLARRAFQLKPEPMYASHYAQMLTAEGRFEEAADLFGWSLAREPENLVIKYRYSEFLEASGDAAAALDTMDEIFALTTDVRAFRPRRDSLAKQLSEQWQSRHKDMFAKDPTIVSAPRRLDRKSGLRRLFRLMSPTTGPDAVAPGADQWRAIPPTTEADLLLTTAPAPPQFAASWRRHLELLKRVNGSRQDLAIVGDSLAEWWPQACWEGLRVFNFGVAGDRTQHLLWRILQLPPQALSARCILVMIGTNNLGCGDSAEATLAGVERVVQALRERADAERILVLETPPLGSDFAWRGEERRRLNEGLRAKFVTLNADQHLIAGATERSPNYAEDAVHLSPAGYLVLTRLVREALDAEAAAPSAIVERPIGR
jgi:lysophospholipase L1-like esterase/tetratricopeptide (TPR) repeat protein